MYYKLFVWRMAVTVYSFYPTLMGPFRYDLSQNLTPSPVAGSDAVHWARLPTVRRRNSKWSTPRDPIRYLWIFVRLPVDLIDDGRVLCIPRRRRRPVIGFFVVRDSPTGRARAQAQQQHGYLKTKTRTIRGDHSVPFVPSDTVDAAGSAFRLISHNGRAPEAVWRGRRRTTIAEVDNPRAQRTLREISFCYYLTNTRQIVGLDWCRYNVLTPYGGNQCC